MAKAPAMIPTFNIKKQNKEPCLSDISIIKPNENDMSSFGGAVAAANAAKEDEERKRAMKPRKPRMIIKQQRSLSNSSVGSELVQTQSDISKGTIRT